ncbi:diguanylate cyclase domain-containing protein [Couchioplanes azureus]|uniref:diguanylate cyclase domain-containing protein n=1 Tax=Couchioplanes caeruleus TaxID=56438 RepID=UPI00166FCEBA|nr:diguanylate cyclase [Couchioplanes caeruleus]
MSENDGQAAIPALGGAGDAGFQALVELSPDIIFVICDGYHVFANARALATMGARTITDLQDRPAIEFMHPDYRDPGSERMRSLTADGEPLQYVEEKLVTLDGTVIDIEAAGTPLEFDGRPAALIVARDITARKRGEAALAAAQERFHAAFRHAPTGMAILDGQGAVTEANPALEELLATPAEEIVGKAYWQWVDVTDRQRARGAFRDLAHATVESCRGDVRFWRPDGTSRWVHVRMAALADSGAFVAHLHDVTAAKAAEQELTQQARTDALTELPNRAALLHHLAGALAMRMTQVAVLFLDLDGFKQINDEFGHAAGDELLRLMGRRLRGAIRTEDMMGRLGGDEFVAILTGPDCEQRARGMAARIKGVVRQPVLLGCGVVCVGASVGVAVGTGMDHEAKDLLAAADSAMYRAKTARYAAAAPATAGTAR